MRNQKPLGWDVVIDLLDPLPVCTLIRAPHSTGKRTVAEYIAKQLNVTIMDLRLFPTPHWEDSRGRLVDASSLNDDCKFVEPELSIDEVRSIIAWIGKMPSTSAGRIAIIRLDGEKNDGTQWVASQRACSALLKTLEEPPAGTRFILLCAGEAPPTIVSRTQCAVNAGLLSLDVVSDVLYRVSDLGSEEAREAAALSGGRIRPALREHGSVGVREAVLGVLSALRVGDTDAVIGRAKEWNNAATELLVRACHEKVSQRFFFFTASDLSDLSVSQAMRLLALLRATLGARPRNVLGAVSAIGMQAM